MDDLNFIKAGGLINAALVVAGLIFAGAVDNNHWVVMLSLLSAFAAVLSYGWAWEKRPLTCGVAAMLSWIFAVSAFSVLAGGYLR